MGEDGSSRHWTALNENGGTAESRPAVRWSFRNHFDTAGIPSLVPTNDVR